MKIENPSKGVTLIKFEFKRNEDWQQWALLTSDRHWDNPDSKRRMQKKHLDQAMERNAVVIDCGDLFCAMQGKNDKRASKSKLRREHQDNAYLNSLTKTACEWFSPYAKNFALIGTGNHETSILNRCEYDLTEELVDKLNFKNGTNIVNGGYTGYARFVFQDDSFQTSRVLHYDHGYGGGGPVTKGAIQTNRRDAFIDSADIICSGHIHESYAIETVHKRLTKSNKIRHATVVHLSIPTYKEEYKTGRGGWHVERGAPPKPLGAWWVRFYYERETNSIRFDYTRAN